MPRLSWDKDGERLYETGVDRGVLYLRDATGVYTQGVVWNGLTTVTEAPSGAEATALYASNIKYLNMISAEEFGGTIEAYTFPDEFMECDGTAKLVKGVYAGQQTRKTFGLSYRTILGNDISLNEYAYKIHIIYGAVAAPSDRSYASVNDSPQAITFSWTVTTTPVVVANLKPTALLTIVSTDVEPDKLLELEDILYGKDSEFGGGSEARLPLPDEIATLLSA